MSSKLMDVARCACSWQAIDRHAYVLCAICYWLLGARGVIAEPTPRPPDILLAMSDKAETDFHNSSVFPQPFRAS